MVLIRFPPATVPYKVQVVREVSADRCHPVRFPCIKTAYFYADTGIQSVPCSAPFAPAQVSLSGRVRSPSLPLKHYPLTIIRPLCLVHEVDIRQVAEELHFTKQKALCPYEETTRRSDMQAVFQQLELLNPEARYSLWRSVFME